MSDTVVLYVTRDGHSRALALDLGARLKAEVLEIGDLVKRRGLLGWIRSGRQASMLAATPIKEPAFDLASVRTVVLVQPVWASAICPPIRTWLNSNAGKLVGKRIALLASAYGTPAAVLRSKYEAEFGPSLGALAACAVALQKEGVEAGRRRIEAFAAELSRA
jgi:hypothetical protein